MPIDDYPELAEGIRRWNTIYRAALLFLAIVSTVGILYGVNRSVDQGHKIDKTTQLVLQIIQDNQKSTLAARQQNTQREEDIKNYVKCIVLLGKKHPDVNYATIDYDQAKALLDECANTQ